MDSRNRLHAWLRATSGDTFRVMADEIATLKKIAPGLYADLPVGDEDLLAGLQELERMNLSRREGSGDDSRWFWKMETEKPGPQLCLF